MEQTRRTFLTTAGAVTGAAVFAPHVARAATFPNGPVSLMVPFTPGGGADRSMRLMAPFLSKELGVPVTVRNVAGGGGWLGWTQMARWDPETDDHKLGCINLPHILSYLDPRMQRQETLDSFNFICWHSYDPCLWAVREDDDRFTTLAGFLEYIEKNPGKVIISSTGVGSDDQMGIAFAEKNLKNFKVRKIYSNGDGKKIKETIGGDTDCVAGNVSYFTPFFLEARLRPLCVLHNERWAQLPSVPTFNEVTGKTDISFAGRTVGCAKGLAKDKFDVYLKALHRTITNPEYVLKELENNNKLMFLQGDKLHARLEQAADRIKKLKYWEVD